MGIRYVLAVGSVVICSVAASGQTGGNTPAAIARESFEALKRRDVAKFVAYFHPDETKRFKAFATEVFKADEKDNEIQQTRKLFAPMDTTEKVAAASGADLLATFLTNSLKQVPGFEETMAQAKFTSL